MAFPPGGYALTSHGIGNLLLMEPQNPSSVNFLPPGASQSSGNGQSGQGSGNNSDMSPNGGVSDANGGSLTPAASTGAAADTSNGLNSYVSSLPDEKNHATDGTVNVSVYSPTESGSDSNSAAARGNNSNLLTPGSVALGSNLIQQLHPAPGQQVLVQGVPVGYYDDQAGASSGSGVEPNTVDIYNPNNSVIAANPNSPGSSGMQTLKAAPAGSVTLGSVIRPQVSNPG